ncbi:MAG: hypothetical protein EBZ49_01765 [Proteobacteria bacterium]|nr:hypothetical protein [Pseudomonadota bacterium]
MVVGCSTVPNEESGSILMEDVIVERTTVRSTTQNPKLKTAGGVHISGDNINIGTLIVNSPNAQVDRSIKVAQSNQLAVVPAKSSPPEEPPKNKVYDTDMEIFNDFKRVMPFLIPNLIMFGVR